MQVVLKKIDDHWIGYIGYATSNRFVPIYAEIDGNIDVIFDKIWTAVKKKNIVFL